MKNEQANTESMLTFNNKSYSVECKVTQHSSMQLIVLHCMHHCTVILDMKAKATIGK